MKYLALLLFGVAALLAQDNARVLEGSVVNSVTGAGIEGATVELAAPADKHHYSAVTDAKGAFRIAGIAPGDYIPLARKIGFVSAQSADVIGGRPPIHVDARVDAGAEPLHPRLELLPPGSVRGRVTGTDGEPAAKVEVALGPQYTTTTTTAEDGGFVFENVNAGQHSLVARAEGVRTYFPAAVDPILAEPIQLAPGADQGGYEIRLQTATVHRVRGIVLDAAGKPVPKAVLQLFSAMPDSGSAEFLLAAGGTTVFPITAQSAGVQAVREKPIVAGDDGAFELPPVREGDWVLRADSDTQNRTTPINVRRDIDDLRIRLEEPFEMHGNVRMTDGSPVPGDPAVMVSLISTDGLPASLGGGISEKGGLLEIGDVTPGRYRIRAMAIGGSYYVTSVMAGAVDATVQPVMVSPGLSEIRVVVKPGGTITGTVAKGDGAIAVLVPESVSAGDVGRTHRCGAGGSFEFTGVPAGDYYLVAVSKFDVLLMSREDRMRAIMRDAVPVHVDDGAAVAAQLKLQ